MSDPVTIFGIELLLWQWIAIAAAILLAVIIIICIIVWACKRGKSAKREKTASAQQSAPKTVEKEENAEPVAEVAPVKEERAKSVAPPVAPAKEDKPAPVKAAAKSAEKPADKKVAKPAEEDAYKVYHISKRRDENRWQIKAEGAARAIKLFNTQAEAIAYAKQLAQNQDARIMIHKEDGSFRKLTY